MKKTGRRGWVMATGCSLALTMAPVPAAAASPEVMDEAMAKNVAVNAAVDWEAFLGRHDLIWESLPPTWRDGAFIGNGRLGAMIYKGHREAEPGAEVLAWTIGRSDLYDNRDPSYSKLNDWTAYYRLPIGRFHLCPTGKAKEDESNMRIDLWNGEATGHVTTDKGKLEFHSWVQPGDAESGVVVIVLRTDDAESATEMKWQPFKSWCPRYHRRPGPYPPNPPGSQEAAGDTQVWIQPLLAGGDYSTAWKTVHLGENRRAVFIATADGRFKGGSAKTAVAAVEAAAKRPLEELRKANRDWWHAFYPRSFVSIPEGRLESHYWIQMYKLGSATREGGVVMDTCGPWLKSDTAWPACWWNLNVQLTHYPIAVANHLDLEEPLIRLLKQEFDNGNLIRNAPEDMRHDSAYFGNPTTTENLINRDVWRYKNNRGARLNQLPWICHTLWEHYRRNMDDTFLRETLFPLTRRAYSFIFHFLSEGEDGRLNIKNVFSSEYGAADNANEAVAMLQWGCKALLWMTDRLKIDDPDIPRWKDILARLVDPPVDEFGLMIGSNVSFKRPHRHYSHLMALVPFRIWDFEEPAARKLAFKSVDWFLREPRHPGMAGYTFTGGANMYAMLGDGDKALFWLKAYMQKWDRASTMYLEGYAPVMETPPSAARVVQDMLLQSHDVIRIFPAVPSPWKDAAFHKLLAEGAFEVSAVRKDGKTRFVLIKSLAGEPCRVKTDLQDPVLLTAAGMFPVKMDKKGIITLELAKGEEAVLAGKEISGPLAIEPVNYPASEFNFYGLKKKP